VDGVGFEGVGFAVGDDCDIVFPGVVECYGLPCDFRAVDKNLVYLPNILELEYFALEHGIGDGEGLAIGFSRKYRCRE